MDKFERFSILHEAMFWKAREKKVHLTREVSNELEKYLKLERFEIKVKIKENKFS
jgi:hypothetical protein